MNLIVYKYHWVKQDEWHFWKHIAQLHDQALESKQYRQRAKRCHACDGILLESFGEANDSRGIRWKILLTETHSAAMFFKWMLWKSLGIEKFDFFSHLKLSWIKRKLKHKFHMYRNEPHFTAVHFDFWNCHWCALLSSNVIIFHISFSLGRHHTKG